MATVKQPRLVETRSGKKILEGEESRLRQHVEVNYPRAHEDNSPDVRLVLPDGSQQVYTVDTGWQKGHYTTEDGWTPAEESEPSSDVLAVPESDDGEDDE